MTRRVICRRAVLVALLGIGLVAAPSAAATSAGSTPPLLGLSTVAGGLGSAAALVRAERPWSVTIRDITLTAPTWAAFAVFGAEPDNARFRYVVVMAPRPAGCTAPKTDGTRTCPARQYVSTVEDAQSRSTPTAADASGRLHYPAGRYRVTLLTQPGQRVQLRWRVPEARGTARLAMSQRVEGGAYFRAATGQVAASLDGSFDFALRHRGTAVLDTWTATNRGALQNAASTHVCLDTRGSTRSDRAANLGCARGLDPNTVTSSDATGTADGYQSGGLVRFALAAGSYTGRFAGTVVGNEPATGVSAVWFSNG